jgi:hypothetical protein
MEGNETLFYNKKKSIWGTKFDMNLMVSAYETLTVEHALH